MKIEWEAVNSWMCFACDGRHFKITELTENWVDYECLSCGQRDAMLRTDFILFIKEETKNE